MPESVNPGRRAIELCGAALAGVAVGLIAGWLAFGRKPRGELLGRRPETGQLSESVRALSEAVSRLAAAQSQGSGAGVKEPPKVRPAPPRIAPGVKFRDTFETGTHGWFVARFAPEIIGELARTEEEGRAKTGRGALALRYVLEPGKVPLVARMARGINRLSLWIRTLNRPAEIIIGVQERDESDYQTMVHIEPGEGWKHLDLDLGLFVLGDDSKDENDGLDFHEIRSVSVIDAAGFMGGRGENVLLIDEVVGEYRAGEPPPPAEKGERF